jgi:hypothetical protein
MLCKVDEPMLSMVATRSSAESQSGARVPSERQAPLELIDTRDEAQDFGAYLDGMGSDHGHRYYPHLYPFRQSFVMGDRRIDKPFTPILPVCRHEGRTGVKVSTQTPRRPMTHGRVIEVVRFMQTQFLP